MWTVSRSCISGSKEEKRRRCRKSSVEWHGVHTHSHTHRCIHKHSHTHTHTQMHSSYFMSSGTILLINALLHLNVIRILTKVTKLILLALFACLFVSSPFPVSSDFQVSKSLSILFNYYWLVLGVVFIYYCCDFASFCHNLCIHDIAIICSYMHLNVKTAVRYVWMQLAWKYMLMCGLAAGC